MEGVSESINSRPLDMRHINDDQANSPRWVASLHDALHIEKKLLVPHALRLCVLLTQLFKLARNYFNLARPQQLRNVLSFSHRRRIDIVLLCSDPNRQTVHIASSLWILCSILYCVDPLPGTGAPILEAAGNNYRR